MFKALRYNLWEWIDVLEACVSKTESGLMNRKIFCDLTNVLVRVEKEYQTPPKNNLTPTLLEIL